MHMDPYPTPAHRRPRFPRLALLIGLIVVGLAGISRADEEEPETPKQSVKVYTMPEWTAGPMPRTPLLRAPSDFWSATDRNFAELWWSAGPTEQPWLERIGPPHERLIAEPEYAVDLLSWLHEPSLGVDGEVSFEPTLPHARAVVAAYVTEQAKLRKTLDRLRHGIAPSIVVEARLERLRPEPELLATGRMRLHAGRWGAPVQTREISRFVARWDIEIAQAATTTDANPMPLQEGHDVLLRYLPGESGDLVQFWACDLENQETWRLDLSEIHALSAGNSMGAIEAPITGIRRSHGCMWLDPQARGTKVIRYANDQGAFALTLSFSERSTPFADTVIEVDEEERAADLERGIEQRELPTMALVRSGAAFGHLDFGVRFDETEFAGEAALREATNNGLEVADYVMQSVLERSGVTVVRAPKAFVAMTRERVRLREVGLHGGSLKFTAIHCDGSAVAGLVREGRLRAGAPLSEEALTLLRSSNGPSESSYESPFVPGLSGGMRMGRSVPGLVDMESEVAQEAAAVAPVSSAQFDGLMGHFEVQRLESEKSTGYTLSFKGTWSYADAENSKMEHVFRIPVSPDPKREGQHLGELTGPSRRVVLPILGFGSQRMHGEAALTGAGPHVLALGVRGGRAVVLFAEVSLAR